MLWIDTLRVKKLARDYNEVCFDINYLYALSVNDLKFKFSNGCMIAHKEVIYWVPPCQLELEGTSDFELHK